jgi:hypothetical protein
MPLKVIDYGPGERPAIFCDACGKEITRAADGNYHWHSQVDGADPQAVYYSHKSECCDVVDLQFKTTCCMELDHFLLCFVKNMQWDQKKAESTQRLMDTTG